MTEYQSDQVIDLNGKFVYPGFIDAHCHFYSYAKNLQWINLVGTESFDEIHNSRNGKALHKNEKKSVRSLCTGIDLFPVENKAYRGKV